MEEESLTRNLLRLRSQQVETAGPTVSIVVANRDGSHHLRRLLDGLDRRTRYRSFELVLVDNASKDDSCALVESWDGPTRIVRNHENKSFSETNNQGIREATGELVLLANNDIDPIHPDWLGYMVDSLSANTSCVGAMLVYPHRPKRSTPPAFPDFTVQHLGVVFERSKWGVRASNLGQGSDPLLVTSPERRTVPAVTAACLLARRSDLLEEPLDEEYWYGTEDWDLCLRLGQRGDVVIDERAVLFHHEYGTQDQHMSDAWLEARTRNHQWFNELWGPSVRRRIRAESLEPSTSAFFGHATAPTVLILGGRRHRPLKESLKHQAELAGWSTSHDERTSADLVIATQVPKSVHRFAGHDVSVAIVSDEHEEWSRSAALDSATHVLVADRVGQAKLAAVWGKGIARIDPSLRGDGHDTFTTLIERLSTRNDVMRIGVSTAAPSWEKAQVWGDTFLARGLMRAFRRLGYETSELIQPDWSGPMAMSCDVVIHLRGLHRRPVARGQWNILWIISHPDRVEADEYDDYDLICCASQSEAERLTAQLGRTVHFLPQATDVDTFGIGSRNVDFEDDVLYVGIARWPNRRAPRWMARAGRDFQLYGRNWNDFAEARLLRGEFIANRDLATAYRSAKVVVADHHGSMRTTGFVANRIFDVLASGGFVLSDDVRGLEDLFDDAVPTFSNAQELELQLNLILSNDARRRSDAERGRQLVLDHHTLDHRAETILGLLDEL